MTNNPDINWYRQKSSDLKKTPRCPFSSVYRCARYYQSLSLLGEAGLTTRMEDRKDKKLLRKWKKTEFWPTVSELETSITGSDTKTMGYRHFCPEVMYNFIGYFADYLHDYVDEIDRDYAIRNLKKEHADRSDYRWRYMSLHSIHFTECELYSLLENYRSQHEDVFEFKPNFYGVGINFNALFRRFKKK